MKTLKIIVVLVLVFAGTKLSAQNLLHTTNNTALNLTPIEWRFAAGTCPAVITSAPAFSTPPPTGYCPGAPLQEVRVSFIDNSCTPSQCL